VAEGQCPPPVKLPLGARLGATQGRIRPSSALCRYHPNTATPRRRGGDSVLGWLGVGVLGSRCTGRRSSNQKPRL
jgi:hypothetical protein